MEADAIKRGEALLQMPPVKNSWTSHSADTDILSSDPEITNFDPSGCRYIFTDITYGLPRRVTNNSYGLS